MFPRRPIFLGGIIAPIFWTGLLHSILGLLNPLLNELISWPWFIASQFAFGIVAGMVVVRQERVRTRPVPALPHACGIRGSGNYGRKEGEEQIEMKFSALILKIALGLSALVCGCGANAPGQPLPGESRPIVPSEIADFNVLYGQNCAGCHGMQGKGGAAIALAGPVYLAVADECSCSACGGERNRRHGDACFRAKRRRNAH